MRNEIRKLICVILLTLVLKMLPECEFKKAYRLFILDNLRDFK